MRLTATPCGCECLVLWFAHERFRYPVHRGSHILMPPHPSIGPRQIRWHLKPHRARIVALATSSFLSGVLEAMFLVIAARAALAIAAGDSVVEVTTGQVHSVAATTLLAGLLVTGRFALSMLGVSISTQLAQYVTVDLRRRVTATYLDSSWPVHSAEPAG